MIEHLREIFNSIKHNQIRTLLSGFGVSWGILILVVLLGAGTGFQHGVMSLFDVFAQKSIYIYGGTTSKKHKNHHEGSPIRFDDKFLTNLKEHFNDINKISAESSRYFNIQSKQRNRSFRVLGVDDDYMQIKILEVNNQGRNLNRYDIKKNRNIAVIGENVANFISNDDENLLNNFIIINGLSYKVVGVLKNDNIFGASEINSIYIPITSYNKELSSDDKFTSFCLSLHNNIDSKQFEVKLKSYIAAKLNFDYDDKQALYIVNFETQTSSFESLFNGLKMFIWVIGICFLISGIVGIGNIMFVSVKERTNEIGVRLAVGATPRSIMNLILLESIVVTSMSGIIGLALGRIILIGIDWFLSSINENIIIEKTILELPVAMTALIILIIAGVIAGMIPAVNAARIEPVDAIRFENRN